MNGKTIPFDGYGRPIYLIKSGQQKPRDSISPKKPTFMPQRPNKLSASQSLNQSSRQESNIHPSWNVSRQNENALINKVLEGNFRSSPGNMPLGVRKATYPQNMPPQENYRGLFSP